jgi:hypothetical protein
MTRRLLPLAVALVLVACAESEPISVTTSTTEADPMVTTTSSAAAKSTSTSTISEETLPPHELAELAAIFDPIVDPLGYRVSRAALIVRSTYQVDPDGDHLAIYLAPLDDITPEQFAADLTPIVTRFVPEVFERWPDLLSFDVCQEPFASEAETPPSLTLVDVTRRAAAQVDWSGIELSGLIEAGANVDGLTVWARTRIVESAPWQAAASG